MLGTDTERRKLVKLLVYVCININMWTGFCPNKSVAVVCPKSGFMSQLRDYEKTLKDTEQWANADHAFYELQNPKEQIQPYVFDEMCLDELFEQKGDVELGFYRNVSEELEKVMIGWRQFMHTFIYPTYDRFRKGLLKQVLEDDTFSTDKIDFLKLGTHQKNLLLRSILKLVGEDYEKLLRSLRAQIDRVGIQVPKIEVRYENFSATGEMYIVSRALPTLANFTLNIIENARRSIHLAPSKKKNITTILKNVSGIVKPSRGASVCK